MKKRKIYRYTGKDNLTVLGMPVIRPGQFISRKLFDTLDSGLTIEQEIRV